MGKTGFTTTRDITQEGIKFSLNGHLDSISADVFQLKLEEALNEGHYNMILNMSEVGYISSSGLKVILKIYKEAKKAGGDLKIEQPSESVKTVLRITSLDELLLP